MLHLLLSKKAQQSPHEQEGSMSKAASTKQWLSVKEVADYLGVQCSTIYMYVSERRIPYHKIPGSQLIKFKLAEVDEWMATGRVETKEEYLARVTKSS